MIHKVPQIGQVYREEGYREVFDKAITHAVDQQRGGGAPLRENALDPLIAHLALYEYSIDDSTLQRMFRVQTGGSFSHRWTRPNFRTAVLSAITISRPELDLVATLSCIAGQPINQYLNLDLNSPQIKDARIFARAFEGFCRIR